VTPILDPRNGDLEDDASSTKQHTLLSLAGSLLAEISLPKLAIAWVLLIGLPGLLLGAAPLLISLWVGSVSSKAANFFTELWPALLLPGLLAIGWFGGHRLFRLAETSFWSLNALAVQPTYVAFREGFRHLAERMLPADADDSRRASLRAASAAAAGLALLVVDLAIIALAWPWTRWIVEFADLQSSTRWIPVMLANAVVLVTAYFAVAAVISGFADALMPQPRNLRAFASASVAGRRFRIAHLSDIHVVAERYGFRVESGRAGPRGNDRFQCLLARLDAIHAADPLDFVLITGDMTDAGRSGEWAEFFGALAAYPKLAERAIALPGNHDVNIADRANPAKFELPTSPTKRLRQMRTLSALGALQGGRFHTVAARSGALGPTLTDALAPHATDMRAFGDAGSRRLGRALAALWEDMFPQVLPPESETGLGIIVLNSNAETHFSFTNALGLVSADQARALKRVTARYPRACWIVALHHHVIEYPQRATALSERIGTALVNGSWFVRDLQRLSGRVVVMHGHRHIDWIGECGGLVIVSAPSPVMNARDADDTYFYIHTLTTGIDGRLGLLRPERIVLPGAADVALGDTNPSAAAASELARAAVLASVTHAGA
jgi:3',5'-cyclic AMP phosphodiesterase CpdA